MMSGWKDMLATVFNVRPGEGLALSWLLLVAFCKGLCFSTLEPASNALFLSAWGPEYLPQVYILTAVATVIFGAVYARFEGAGMTPVRLMTGLLCFLAFGNAVFYTALMLSQARWLALGLMVWKDVHWVLLNIELWAIASFLFNVRQGKRLFAVVGAGDIIGIILGGLLVGPLVEHVLRQNPVNLLIITLSAVVISLFALRRIGRAFRHRFAAAEKEEEASSRPLLSLFKERYLGLFFLVSTLSFTSFYFMDYVFYGEVDNKIVEWVGADPGNSPRPTSPADVPPDGWDQLPETEKTARIEAVAAQQADWDTEYEPKIGARTASFFGVFFAILGTINLLTSSLLSGRLLTRFGLSVGLLALPLVLIATTGAAVLAQTSFGIPWAFFWLIMATKQFDEVLRNSFETPSYRILYQPIPAKERLQVQTVRESMVEPTAIGLSGAFLLLFTSAAVGLEFGGLQMASVALGVMVVWIGIAVLLRREYTLALARALQRRHLGGDLDINDASSLSVLENGLGSTIPAEVIYCLNMLEDADHPMLGDILIKHVGNASPRVRRHVLERIEGQHLVRAIDRIEARIDVEDDAVVLGSLLRTLCALAETEAFERVEPFTEHGEVEVRRGALVGLLRSGGIEGVLTAGSTLRNLLDSPRSPDRRFAAQVLGEVGISSFYRPLVKLIEDEEEDVRKAALEAAGKLGNVKLVPLVLSSLAQMSLRDRATGALVAFGEQVLPAIEAAFAEEGKSREVRNRLVRVCHRIGGADARRLLVNQLDYPDQSVRHRILLSLAASSYQAGETDAERVRNGLSREVNSVAWTLATLGDIGGTTESPLVRALHDEFYNGRDRCLLLISFLFASEAVLDARANLASTLADKRAFAVEILDNVTTQDVSDMIMPLIDDLTAEQRLSRLQGRFPQERRGRGERLRVVIGRSQAETSFWTKACAVYMAGRARTGEVQGSVIEALADPDPLVRETAVWALGQLNPDDLADRLQDLLDDGVARVAAMARLVIESVGMVQVPVGYRELTRSGRLRVELFVNVLADGGERRARRCRAAAILGTLGGDKAGVALVQSLKTIEDETIRSAILEALVKGRFELDPGHREQLQELINIELEDVRRTLWAVRALAGIPDMAQLVDALASELDENRSRLLTILVLLGADHDAQRTLRYWYLESADQAPVPADVQSRRDGLLRSVSSESARSMVGWLLDERDPVRLAGRVLGPGSSVDESEVAGMLRDLAFGESSWIRSWTRAIALQLVGARGMVECIPAVIEAMADVDGIVRETAASVLFSLDATAYRAHADRLRNDPSPLVTRVVRRLAANGGSADAADD